MKAQVKIVRSNADNRNDFLEFLLRENREHIVYTAMRFGRSKIDSDFIRNDCAQMFLIAANRAIDSFREEDDGRGANDLAGWCKAKGVLAVADFVRNEFGREGNSPRKLAMYPIHLEDLPPAQVSRSVEDQSESVISYLTVQEILSKLDVIDRAILSLLIFGWDENFGRIRNSSLYGKPKDNTALHVATTLGVTAPAVHARLLKMRTKIAV